MNKRIFISIFSVAFVVAGTFTAIKFAQGYRPNIKQGTFSPTGLLSANSYPNGSQVYVDGKLTTATDDTINLPPGEYEVKITKEGFIPWQKTLQLQKELVTQTNARLFPAVPDLKALTFSGATNITPSPDGQKIAFAVASASARTKNGLWILELSSKPLSFSNEPKQIAQNNARMEYQTASLIWSPDGKNILASNNQNNLLLEADRMNNPDNLTDVTARMPLILEEWETQVQLREEKKLEKLPIEMQQIATQSATHLYWSPEEKKLMYTATASATIPQNLVKTPPAVNTQPEQREIQPDNIYVYDLEEDKNFFITSLESTSQPTAKETDTDDYLAEFKEVASHYSPLRVQPLQWFPSSKHLISTKNDKITILEYDGTNRAVVYTGKFKEDFVYPWPDGSQLIILTNLNPESSYPANIYAINLK
jgi:WD40 repeat protein